jgi:hypothetical protein
VISKCANPKCSAVFRYLHEGKLFEFEVRSLDDLSLEARSVNGHAKPSQEVECFWLCDSCASTMTLVREPGTHAVVIVPVHEHFQESRNAVGMSTDEQLEPRLAGTDGLGA